MEAVKVFNKTKLFYVGFVALILLCAVKTKVFYGTGDAAYIKWRSSDTFLGGVTKKHLAESRTVVLTSTARHY